MKGEGVKGRGVRGLGCEEVRELGERNEGVRG